MAIKISYFLVSRVISLYICPHVHCHPKAGSMKITVQNKWLFNTPSIPNYKSFQESWRVKPSQSLTKIPSINLVKLEKL